ncbi:Uncharacterized protein TCM_005949 [Theobroma cacao]|uniref:HAT C-terminal dimerisation domain-containing protein n=1 Tax=Theobroma cacao TaxID=3641 RepID=A0A061E3E6_THECC|nr:Uncharacterized protein TCM_005949 [Theobroma cacao]
MSRLHRFANQSQVSQISEFDDDVDSSASVALLNEFKRYKIAIGMEEDKWKLEKYLSLNEPNATDSDDFDVLMWWKLNSHRYFTLALLARDVLAILSSTIASESAFSTGGRVLDAYKSSLMPKMMQALSCAQDWQRGPFYYLYDIENDLVELEKVDEVMCLLAAAENQSQAPVIALPFVAPPLSLASFLPSEHPSVVEYFIVVFI